MVQSRGLSTISGLSNDRATLGLISSSSSGGALGSISSGLSGMSARGTRGSSIDRGRGRARGLYHSTLGSYQRSAFLYEEEARGAGARGERSWAERNGTAGSETDWNNTSVTTSPSPRKDFSSLRSNAGSESWRRSRIEDDSVGTNVNGSMADGWRTPTNSSMYKWRK